MNRRTFFGGLIAGVAALCGVKAKASWQTRVDESRKKLIDKGFVNHTFTYPPGQPKTITFRGVEIAWNDTLDS